MVQSEIYGRAIGPSTATHRYDPQVDAQTRLEIGHRPRLLGLSNKHQREEKGTKEYMSEDKLSGEKLFTLDKDAWVQEEAKRLLALEKETGSAYGVRQELAKLAREKGPDIVHAVASAMFTEISGGRKPTQEESMEMLQLANKLLPDHEKMPEIDFGPPNELLQIDPIFNGKLKIHPADAFITAGQDEETGKWMACVMKQSPGSETGFDLVVQFNNEYDSADEAKSEASKVLTAVPVMVLVGQGEDTQTTFEWPNYKYNQAKEKGFFDAEVTRRKKAERRAKRMGPKKD
jgi:hypothetical protein